eukprot:5472077-Pleurochrysis_carterae.AAC.1
MVCDSPSSSTTMPSSRDMRNPEQQNSALGFFKYICGALRTLDFSTETMRGSRADFIHTKQRLENSTDDKKLPGRSL